MKKVFKLFLLIFSAIVILNVAGVKKSEAGVKSEINFNSENSDFLLIVRSVENGKHYIYIYTDSGLLLCKSEEY